MLMSRAVMIKKKQEAEDTMIKIIGCMLVIIGCGAIGFLEAEKMKKRLTEMQYIRRYVLFMKGEIRYGKKTIPETLLQLERRANGGWKQFFKKTGKIEYYLKYKNFKDEVNEVIESLKWKVSI